MLSDIWNDMYFWNQYGDRCNNIEARWLEEAEGNRELVVQELAKVNRVVVEAAKELKEETWLDIAIKAKAMLGREAVLDITHRKDLLGGGRVIVGGRVVDNSIRSRYWKWRQHE